APLGVAAKHAHGDDAARGIPPVPRLGPHAARAIGRLLPRLGRHAHRVRAAHRAAPAVTGSGLASMIALNPAGISASGVGATSMPEAVFRTRMFTVPSSGS